jgi:uncharacterized protein (DUF2384 family)
LKEEARQRNVEEQPEKQTIDEKKQKRLASIFQLAINFFENNPKAEEFVINKEDLAGELGIGKSLLAQFFKEDLPFWLENQIGSIRISRVVFEKQEEIMEGFKEQELIMIQEKQDYINTQNLYDEREKIIETANHGLKEMEERFKALKNVKANIDDKIKDMQEKKEQLSKETTEARKILDGYEIEEESVLNKKQEELEAMKKKIEGMEVHGIFSFWAKSKLKGIKWYLNKAQEELDKIKIMKNK